MDNADMLGGKLRDRINRADVGNKHTGMRAKDVQHGGNHYKKMGVEPWDVVDTWPFEQRIGYYRGGALKYIMRMGSKDISLQEIRKGQHYIQKLLELLDDGSGG
jgi:hypothetical protein